MQRPYVILQPACKPGSVWFSIIYLAPSSLAGSYDLPPGIGRAALGAGIHGLSTHKVYGFRCYHRNR